MITLPIISPTWVDRHTLEAAEGPLLPSDLTGNWNLAISALDHGLLRLRTIHTQLIVETTEDPQVTLTSLRSLLAGSLTLYTRVRVANLRTQAVVDVSIHRLLAQSKPPTLAAALKKKPLFDYVFPDICDAATSREQHHAVYGSRLRLDWERLNLETALKILTFAHPEGFPHIRMATRHPVLGLRDVYLVVGLQHHEIQHWGDDKIPVAWAQPWEGVAWEGGAPRPFDFRDAEAVAELFGEFDLGAVNGILKLAAEAHGWNQLPFPRAWEGVNSLLGISSLKPFLAKNGLHANG